MRRDSFGFFIFRIGVGVCVVALLGLLYWSSVLQEQDLKALRREMGELQKEAMAATGEAHRLRQQVAMGNYAAPVAQRAQIDPSLPNLLNDDPYYATVLPKQLGPNFRPEGTLHVGEGSRPTDFHPFANWVPVTRLMERCVGKVAALPVGRFEDFAPNLAVKMELRSQPGEPAEYWIHLRDDISWEPLRSHQFPDGMTLAPEFFERHPVTAGDFKFWFDAVMNPFVQEPGAAALRNFLEDVEEFLVVDDKTFVVRWGGKEVTRGDGEKVYVTKYIARIWTGALQPLPSFVFQHFADGSKIVEDDDDPETYRKDTVWAQNFSQHWAKGVIVSCGPWIFDAVSDREVRLKRNPNFWNPYAALTQEIVVSFKEGIDALWQSFKAGEIDTFDSRGAYDKLMELSDFMESETYKEQETAGGAIRRIDYIDRSYSYIGWNRKNPLFESKAVRRAMTMAIDRHRIITQNLNDMGIETTGPFFPNSPSYDPTIQAWPYDPAEALRLLHQEGWEDHDGDGILDKMIDGKRVKFSFALTYYVNATFTRIIVDYIATALREIGIECHPKGLDIADLTYALEGKDIDAYALAWVLGTPPDEPKQIWHSLGAEEKGSSNIIGFANPEIDSLIEELQYEYDPQKRQELYYQFDQIIHDDAPYTFLYTPKLTFLYRDYVKNVFIPADRTDLIPGADVGEPDQNVIWVKPHG